MSTSTFSSDSCVTKETSTLIQKIALLSSSENKQQSQQSKLWIENNEDEKDVQNVDVDEDEDENDSDYEINKEEEEEENKKEENDDKLLDEICINDENDNEDENVQDLDNNEEEIIDVKEELKEAVDVVKNIALKHKEMIVSKIIEYQARNGEEITCQHVQDAFKLLEKQLNKDDEKEEEEDDEEDDDDELQEEEEEELDEVSSENDVDEDELGVEIEDEVEEYENELSASEEEYDENDVDDLSAQAQQALSEEIEEAMQIASELGKQAREELSTKYYETLIEITGEEPTQEQINNIFQRMQEELSKEAEEELFDNYEESYEDDCIDVTSILLNKISSLHNEDKKEIFEESQSIIPQETQNELKQQYINSCGKEPNEEEFQNIMITLAQTTFTDQYFSDNINDSDYDPEQDSQKDEQENDQDEYSSEEDDEMESLRKNIGIEILQQCIQAFETKFGREPNYDEQVMNVELLLNSEQFQQFCQTTAVENNAVENSDQF